MTERVTAVTRVSSLGITLVMSDDDKKKTKSNAREAFLFFVFLEPFGSFVDDQLPCAVAEPEVD